MFGSDRCYPLSEFNPSVGYIIEQDGMCSSTNVLFAIISVTILFITECQSHSGPHTHKRRQRSDKDNKFHDPNIVRDKEHIQEHYDGKASVNTSAMTDEELEFHYFKLHDLDNNTKLDGLEILHAITHMLPYEGEEGTVKPDLSGKTPEEIKQVIKNHNDDELKYYTDIIDRVLEDDDIDNDGYLTYLEYMLARRRDEANQRVHKGKQ